MNKIKILSVISLALLSSSAFSAQDRIVRSLETERCSRSGIAWKCQNVFNRIQAYNDQYMNAEPKREKVIVGYLDNGDGDFFQITHIQVETRMYLEVRDPIEPDYPENLPEHLQPNERPDTVYSDNEEVDEQEVINRTYDLESEIKESADSRIQNQLQTAQFQFRKQSCENTDQDSINKCYTTSPDGAVKKVDTGEE
jgi:hypothetical protein